MILGGLGRLTNADITNIGGSTWSVDYAWSQDGNLRYRKEDSDPCESAGYDGDIMTSFDGNNLDWDLNGNLTDGITQTMIWNWGKKLRSSTVDRT